LNTQDAAEPFYSEEELDEFYRNLLLPESQAQEAATIPGPSSPDPLLSGPANDTIKRLERRFRDVHDLTPPMQKTTHVPYQLPSLTGKTAEPDAQSPHLSLLHRLNRLIEKAETSYRESFPSANVVASSSSSSSQPKQPPIPLALISYKEWFDLVRHCVRVDCYLSHGTPLTVQCRCTWEMSRVPNNV
jgi:hypothetical protein